MVRPFEGIFGNTCELRLLEFLLPLSDMQFNITELSDEAGVNRVTTGKAVKKFVEWGIITASNDRITQYYINPESPIVQSIENVNNAIIERMLGEEKLREIREHIHEHALARRSHETGTSTENAWGQILRTPQEEDIWGAGDGCCNNGPTPFSAPPNFATADVSPGIESPGYFQ